MATTTTTTPPADVVIIRWRTLNTLINLWLIIAVVGVVSIRCGLDADTCKNGQREEVTLSYLLDYGALRTFAASMLAIGAFAEILMGIWAWYPTTAMRAVAPLVAPLVAMIRIVHTAAWVGALGVGIFTVREHRQIHYTFAAVLFGLLGVESMLLLAAAVRFRIKRFQWTVAFQVLVLIAMSATFVAFLATKSGWFEVSSIMICVLNYNFLNYDCMHYNHVYNLKNEMELVGVIKYKPNHDMVMIKANGANKANKANVLLQWTLK